jgi:6-phosphogluconolactonase
VNMQELAAERGLPVLAVDNPQILALRQAEFVGEQLRKAIGERGSAYIALSGGRSPEAFLRCLDEQALDWSRVAITLVDERWVVEADIASNAGLIQRCLPKALASANWLPLFRGDTPQSDAQIASLALAAWLPLDIVVLGMGTDGHCASMFSGQDGLEELLNTQSPILCASVRAPDGVWRMTLTGAALRTGRLQVLAISGKDKYLTLCEAFSASTTLMPVAAFLAPPLHLFYSPGG